MPRRTRRRRKTKFVTKRALPFLLSRNAEAKRLDIEIISSSVTESTSLDLEFFGMSQGDSVSQRIGNEIKVSGFMARCTFSIDPTFDLDRPFYARILLWMPRGDISEPSPNPGPTELLDPEKYVVWVDRVIPLPWTNAVSGTVVTIKKRFKPYMKMLFDSGTQGNVQKNALQLSISTDSAATGLQVSVGARMYYRDY